MAPRRQFLDRLGDGVHGAQDLQRAARLAKAAIDANSGEAATRAWSRWYDMDNDRGRQEAKASPKQTVVVPPASQIAKWRPIMESAIAEWASSRPGVDAVLARYRELVADVKAGR